MISTRARLGLSLTFSLLCVILAGFGTGINVYVISIKEIFNVNQTQVEIMASMYTFGAMVTFVQTFMLQFFGFPLTFVIIWLMTSSMNGMYALACHYNNIVHSRPVIIYLIQFLLSASSFILYVVISSVCVRNFSKEHAGKLAGAFSATICLSKVILCGLLELFFFENLTGLFLFSCIMSIIIIGLALVVLYPIAKGHDTTKDSTYGELPNHKDGYENLPEFQGNNHGYKELPDYKDCNRRQEDLRHHAGYNHDQEDLCDNKDYNCGYDELPDRKGYNRRQEELSNHNGYDSRQKELPDHKVYNPRQEELSDQKGYESSKKELPDHKGYNPRQEELSNHISYESRQKELPDHKGYNPRQEKLSDQKGYDRDNKEVTGNMGYSRDNEEVTDNKGYSRGNEEVTDNKGYSRDNQEVTDNKGYSRGNDEVTDNKGYSRDNDEVTESKGYNRRRVEENMSTEQLKELLQSFYFHVVFWSSALLFGCTYTCVANITVMAQASGLANPQNTVYILSLAVVVFRIVSGLVFDKFSSETCGLLILITACVNFTAAVVLGLLSVGPVVTMTMSFLIGISQGIVYPMPVSLLILRFGRQYYGLITSALFTIGGTFQIIFQILTGYLYDLQINDNSETGSLCQEKDRFRLSFIMFSFLGISLGVIQLFTCISIRFY